MKWELLQWPAVPHAAVWRGPCTAYRIGLPLSIWFGMSSFALESLASFPSPSDFSHVSNVDSCQPQNIGRGDMASWRGYDVLKGNPDPAVKVGIDRTSLSWPLCWDDGGTPHLFMQIANSMDLGLCVSKSNWRLLPLWTGSHTVKAKIHLPQVMLIL